VALVIVGLALGFVDVFTDVELTSDLILLVFLPPPLFEGAINLDLEDLVSRPPDDR
jgi:CPA1 family monovalent cation:H+ antiporter